MRPEMSGTALALPASTIALADDIWDQARYDAEIRAACRQMNRGMSELADAKVRLAMILLRLRQRQDYRNWGYAKLEEYLHQVHKIGKDAAHDYMRSLESLGPDMMRRLLMDVGAQRTYALAQIREIAPDTFDAMLALPEVDGGPAVAAMEVQELQEVNAELQRRLEVAYQRYVDKEDELAAATQNNRATLTRADAIEGFNRDLVVARDRAEKEQARAEQEAARERSEKAKIAREAKRTIAMLQRQLRELSEALRRPESQDDEAEPIQVIASSDPKVLRGILLVCALALRNAREAALHTVAAPAREVGAAVAELIEAGVPAILVAAVCACAAAIRDAATEGTLTAEEAAQLREALRELGGAITPLLPATEQ
jgi:hypothetical protein